MDYSERAIQTLLGTAQLNSLDPGLMAQKNAHKTPRMV